MVEVIVQRGIVHKLTQSALTVIETRQEQVQLSRHTCYFIIKRRVVDQSPQSPLTFVNLGHDTLEAGDRISQWLPTVFNHIA